MQITSLLTGLCLLLFSSALSAQGGVIINEVVASNSQHFDEDGDSPDWLELRNLGPAPVSLAGWQLTDDPENDTHWTIPDITIAPDEHLLVWASGKDRQGNTVARTFVTRGDQFRYLVPVQPVADNWKSPGFNDGNWGVGTSGFGYGDGDDATEVPGGTQSVFVRKRFTVASPGAVEQLLLDVDYDDGFVAYLNGTEIARANIDGDNPAYDASARTFTEPALISGGFPTRYTVENPQNLLQAGENVLAVQVHNFGSGSSDLTLIPFLSAIYRGPTEDGGEPDVVLPIPVSAMHTDFKVSTAGETVYLLNAAGEIVNSLESGELAPDVSRGVPYNDVNQLVYFGMPTPGAPNTGQPFAGIVTDDVVFSHPGGVTGALNLELSGATAPAVIRYTRDAHLPTVNDPIYTGPLSISSTTVVRARIFRDDYLPSAAGSRTFLMGADHTLPVVNLVTEPANLFDDETGIYVFGNNAGSDFPFFGANFWEDWERPVHFSLYDEDGPLEVALNGGIKIFGGWSRGQAQRSFSLFARKQYGPDEIDYPVFASRPYDSYQALVLRNSGNDFLNSNMRDRTLTSLMEGAGLEVQANRPAVTYINGEYWGFYNLREKVNEHFLGAKFDLDPDEINIVELEGQTIHGDNQAYRQLMEFVADNSLASSTNYAQVAAQIDIENFIIYNVAQIYFNNTDWPGNNIKYWQPVGGKWRWILFDTDFGFGTWGTDDHFNNTLAFALNDDGPNWPNPPWSTLLFRRLMSNATFRNEFVNRYADEMNSRFLPQRVTDHINERANEIAPEIVRHFERWGGDLLYWQTRLESMRNFGNQRPLEAKRHIRNTLSLPAYRRLTVNITDAEEGFVRINNRLTITENTWRGDYFQSVPFAVEAVANDGYVFSHWESNQGAQDQTVNALLSVNITAATSLRPVFTEDPTSTRETTITGLEVFPNPFADHLDLRFSLRARAQVRATLYESGGAAVRQFLDRELPAGPQSQSVALGELPAGAYFLELRAGVGTVVSRRLIKR